MYLTVIRLEAKTQIGMINAVKSKKHSEIPSKPKDKFKLYSGIKDQWQTNWKSGLDLSKWYKRSIQRDKKPNEAIRAKLRTISSSSTGRIHKTIVQNIKYSIRISSGCVVIVDLFGCG